MAAQQKAADWEKIEGQYRAGFMSLRDIAAEHGITEGAIRKRAKRDGWERDLTSRIQAEAESKVAKVAAREAAKHSPEGRAKERVIVEANAQVIADAVLGQRQDVSRARGVVQKLFSQLEAQMDGAEDLERLSDLVARADEDGNVDSLVALMRKVVALPSHVDSSKKLAESLRVLIELERKVLRIKDDTNIEDVAKSVGQAVAEGLSAAEAYKRMLEA